MEGIYHEQPLLDGWGNSGPFYDHRFMGFDQAPYRSVYLPAQPLGPYLQNMQPLPQEGLGDIPDEGFIPDDGLSSDDEDDDADDNNLEVYGHVDLHKTLGQQLAVWCHRTPDTLAIFTPIPGDTLSTAVSFARSMLNCDTAMDRALLLMPGQKRPVDPAVLHAAKPGTSILIVPKYDYVVTLEVTQLDLKLEMVVGVTMTVRSLKARLQRERGFPVDRTDLLFRDEPMENQRHLFDYHVTHGATIFVMLHLVYDIRVTVETFWGHNYELYVDPCMTTAGLLNVVLRRTVSQQAGDVSRYYHLTLPRHALVMYSGDGAAMKWAGCLGLYGLDDGAVFSLSTIALAHQMSVQTIPVLTDGGSVHNFLVSKFDYWSVLALKVHGLLGHPVNLVRLFHGKRELDLATAVGPYSHRTPAVRLDTSLLRADDDVHNGVSLSFRLGNGVVEVLKCAPTRTVRSVKAVLEELGVPNATAYDFFVDGYRLPNSGRVADVVEEYKKPIDLKLRHYPVFVHAPKGVIYKMNVHAQEALKVFKARVEMKTGLSQTDYYLLMAGLPVTDDDSSQVFQTPLAIASSVFLMALRHGHTFLVVWDDWLVKLRLPFYPQASEIKNILWKDRNIPEGSLASVGNFLQWYFAMRASHTGLADAFKDLERGGAGMRQSRPRKRRDVAEATLWKHNSKQMRQLQNELEERHHHHQQPPPPNEHQPPPPPPPPPPQRPQRRSQPQQQLLPPLRPHHHQHQHHHQAAGSGRKEQPGVYYATHRNGRWQRVNPEDLVDSYLRAWSLPPDLAHSPAYNTARDLSGDRLHHHHRSRRRRKHHSAMPDLQGRGQGQGQGQGGRRAAPQWVHSLERLARGDRVEPAHARLAKRNKKRKKRRALQAQIKS